MDKDETVAKRIFDLFRPNDPNDPNVMKLYGKEAIAILRESFPGYEEKEQEDGRNKG